MKTLSIALLMMIGFSSAAYADWDDKEHFARVSRGQARNIARLVAPGAIKDSDLDVRRGVLRWKVETKNRFGHERNVFIDAMTGAVMGVEHDND